MEHIHKYQLAGFSPTNEKFKALIYLFCECGETKKNNLLTHSQENMEKKVKLTTDNDIDFYSYEFWGQEFILPKPTPLKNI